MDLANFGIVDDLATLLPGFTGFAELLDHFRFSVGQIPRFGGVVFQVVKFIRNAGYFLSVGVPTRLDEQLPAAAVNDALLASVVAEQIFGRRTFAALQHRQQAAPVKGARFCAAKLSGIGRTGDLKTGRQDIADPANFDLIIDTSQLTPEGILHQIDTHLLEKDSQ